MPFGKRIAAAVVLLLTIAFHANATPDYDAIEAGFLQRFAQFVSWPENALPPGAPLIIGVVGDDPFARTVRRTVAQKSANGHPIVVRSMKWKGEIPACHMMVINGSGPQIAAMLAASRGRSILTVAEFDLFTERGGIIEMAPQGDHVEFDVNSSAADAAHLKISSKLLRVARAVRGSVEGP